jgi:hypothetical protein
MNLLLYATLKRLDATSTTCVVNNILTVVIIGLMVVDLIVRK